MTEQQFLDECDRLLAVIEDQLDALPIDVDSERSGNVLTIELEDRSKIIVNGNTPLREMWIAAKSGGFHFSRKPPVWIDGRSGDEFFATLTRLLSSQSGHPVNLVDGS